MRIIEQIVVGIVPEFHSYVWFIQYVYELMTFSRGVLEMHQFAGFCLCGTAVALETSNIIRLFSMVFKWLLYYKELSWQGYAPSGYPT